MSNNGEDIIRETFKKLGAAIGVQMQMPDAMIANLGAVLQAQIDLLAELQSTGRLLADDEMRLTAEQVEDVEALVATANPYSAPAARLRALFPATEPAEDVKPVKFRKMTPKYATANFGFPDVTVDPFTPFTRWAYKDSDGDKWAWNGDQWELHVVLPDGNDRPAPAEPAEEETKAETCAVRLCVLPARHSGVHADREGLRWNNPTSSPVVPAPTETGPWQRIEDVPEGVLQIKDRHGRTWLVVGGTWRFEWHDGNWHEPHTNINAQAPFLAAAEEG